MCNRPRHRTACFRIYLATLLVAAIVFDVLAVVHLAILDHDGSSVGKSFLSRYRAFAIVGFWFSVWFTFEFVSEGVLIFCSRNRAPDQQPLILTEI